MSLTLAYGALIAGVALWLFLVSRFRARSWEAVPAIGAPGPQPRPAAKRIGLWVFLAVVSSLFSLFIAAFFMRMGHDTRAPDWRPFPQPLVLWVNTAVLILGSIAMQWARASIARGQLVRTRAALATAGILTVGFLIGQALAWRLMIISGYFDPGNPAVAFFYLLTSIHALHVTGGLIVWGRMLIRMRAHAQGGQEREVIELQRQFRLSVELCTVYWHYLLFVWLVVFALLLTHSIDSQFVFSRLC